MSLLDRYTDRINEQLLHVEKSQREAIIAVGNAMAESVKNGGSVYIYDTGHIVNFELVERGGGLMLLKRFNYSVNVDSEGFNRDRSDVDTNMDGFASYILKMSKLKPGDVLVIGSVSGKSQSVVDLAIEAKKFGLVVVALTSVAFSSSVPSCHSSGKRLYECVDYVLDNCAPATEGMLDIPGLEPKFGAASGLSAALIMWSVCAQMIDKLMEYGIEPSLFKSINVIGGDEYNQKQKQRYQETGY